MLTKREAGPRDEIELIRPHRPRLVESHTEDGRSVDTLGTLAKSLHCRFMREAGHWRIIITRVITVTGRAKLIFYLYTKGSNWQVPYNQRLTAVLYSHTSIT